MLVSKTDSEGRVVSELFMKRPSAKQYPEYYIVINKPIDLKEIFGKIKSEQVSVLVFGCKERERLRKRCFACLFYFLQYRSLGEMMDDVELLVSNACMFNEEESQVYQVICVCVVCVRVCHI